MSRKPRYIITVLGLFLTLVIQIPLPQANSGKVFYSLQLGAFQDEDNAREMAEGLKRLGHNAFYRYSQEGDKEVFRVFIEKYSSKQEAEREAEAMKNLDLIAAYTIKRLVYDVQTSGQPTEISPRGYYLHIDSYANISNVEKRVKEVKDQGHKAFFMDEESSGARCFKVYIGVFESEEGTRKSGSELKAKGLINYFKPFEIDEGLLKE